MFKATRTITILLVVFVCSGAIYAQESEAQKSKDFKAGASQSTGAEPSQVNTSNETRESNAGKNKPDEGPTSSASFDITGHGTPGIIAMWSGESEIMDSVISISDSVNAMFGGTIAINDTTPDSNTGIKLTRSGAIASAFGADFSLTTSLSGSNVYGGRFSAVSNTSGGLPDHPFTVGLSGHGSFAGSGRLDFAQGTESLVFNNGTGHLQDAYATYNQAALFGSTATIGSGYGSYNDVVNASTGSNSLQSAVAIYGRVRNFSSGSITTGYGLRLTDWSKGSGTVGTSYGIYMDSSIDIGTTRYALYSGSASNSYFAGKVGIGTSSPSVALSVAGDFVASGTKSAAVPVSNNRIVRMYAVESTENWFEDYGAGKLVKGVAQIVLDPTFVETVNTGRDYHVFITPNGNCQGLFVAEKTATGFRVRELRGGKSNASFDYRIVARRKGYEDIRLQELPGDTSTNK